MSRLGNSLTVKLLLIGIICLGLLIPMAFIGELIREREGRLREVVAEIGGRWGGRQVVSGPAVQIPARRVLVNNGRSYVSHEHIYLLPDSLDVEATAVPEVRRRGLFETIVYTSELRLRGSFAAAAQDLWTPQPNEIDWEDAALVFAVGDLGGLSEVPTLTWRGEPAVLEPYGDALGGAGSAAAIGDPRIAGGEFELRVVLRGSGRLSFLPLGRDTTVKLEAPWANPSFTGAFLPTASTVDEEGFVATWSIPHFARAYPQALATTQVGEVAASSFGVELLVPVDRYQKTIRCTKYALLFIVLTLSVFFLFELLAGLRLHPLQYLLIGFALCVFYLLLLAVSEHATFAVAYAVAATATVALISGYSAAVLHTRWRALVLGGTLTGLYALLFVLVQLQTYALLVGAVVLFGALAALMYLTRGVDWYAVRLGPTPQLSAE